MIADLTPAQVSARCSDEDPPLLVDVRERWERDLAVIPGSVHIPMGELPSRLDELPHGRDLVLYCHHGSRSLQVTQWLDAQGYDRLSNLDGGIDAWSADVDPSVPVY